MSDDAFNNFEEEFQSITSSLARKIASISHLGGDPGQQKSLIEEAEGDIYDANKALQKIEQEVRHYSYNLKSKAQARLRQLQSDFEAQVAKLGGIKKSIDEGGSGGTGSPAGLSPADARKWKDDRKRLLGAHALTTDTGETLGRTQHAIDETLEAGAATSQALLAQREQIINQRDTVRQTDDLLGRAAGTLRRMRRRIMTNKILQAVIILVEMGIVALIIYLRYYR